MIAKAILVSLVLGMFFVLSGTHSSPPPPVLSVTAPSTAYVDEVILIDARGSVGIHNKPQSNGAFSFTMDLGDGTPLVYIQATGHAYRDPGVYTITVNGKDASGVAAPSVTTTVTVVPIPPATTGNIQELANTGSVATNSINLQNAIENAKNKNIVEQDILLPDGFVAKGIVMIPPAGNKYIRIRWVNLSSLPHKKRINPETQDLSAMPKILAPNNTSVTTPAITVPHPQTTSLVHHYLWQGVHFARENNAVFCQNLVNTGQDVYNGTDSLNKFNHHFIFDRAWFDGGNTLAASFQSGFRGIGNYITVVDSWAAYFRLVGGGVDAEAMSAAITNGPNSYQNNFLVGSSENFNNGGGAVDYRRATISNPTTTSATLSNGLHYLIASDTTEPSALTTENLTVGSIIALPSTSCRNGLMYCVEMVTAITAISGNNITFEAVPHVPTNAGTAQWANNPQFLEFRNNYLTKPTQWRRFLADGRTVNPAWNGDDTQIKNLWEAKACLYCVVDGNYFYHTWSVAQPYALAITVRNDTGQYANTAAIQYLQWSNNVLKDAPNGMNISGSDDGNALNKVSFRTRNIFFVNNLHIKTGTEGDVNGPKDLIRLGGVAYQTDKLRRVFVMHNTFDGSNSAIVDFGADGGAIDSMWFNNVHQFSYNGFRSNFGNPPEVQTNNINTYLPPGNATSWNKNLIVNPREPYCGAGFYAPMPSSALVIGGLNCTNTSTIDTVSFSSQFVDHGAENYTLAMSSPGKGSATDGTDVGVNVSQLLAAIGASSPSLKTAIIRTITGDWSGAAPGPTPSPSPVPSPSALPSPLPTPSVCTMTVNNPVVPQWGSGKLVVTFVGLTQNGIVRATASSGQVTVDTTPKQVSGTSMIAEFWLQGKKKSSSVTVLGPCGTKTVLVNVQ